MSGLPLMKDAFTNGGQAAAAGAATERAAAGHRRPPADGNAFADIVSSLGPAQAQSGTRTAGAAAESTADRHRPAGGSSSPFDLAAGADEPDAGTALGATSTLDPTSSLEAAPDRRTESALRAAAALFRGAASDGDAGLGTTPAERNTPSRASLALTGAVPSPSGAALTRASTARHDRDVDFNLAVRQPSVTARDERVPGPGEDRSDLTATPATGAEPPSDEETSAGVEATRADRLEAIAEPAMRLDGAAVTPSAAPAVQDGRRTADAGLPPSPLPGATDARRVASPAPGTQPSGADAPAAPDAPGAIFPGAAPADTAAPLAHPERAPDSTVPREATLSRPAAPSSARSDGSAPAPLDTGAAPPALPATTAAAPVGSAPAADAAAQPAGAGRVSAQVRDMRTHFAPVTARTFAAAAGGKPDTVAPAGGAAATVEVAAPAVDAVAARAVKAPSAAPAPSPAQPTLAATSPTVIGASSADEIGGPPPAAARSVAEGVRGSGPRDAAPPGATTPDERVTPRQESAAIRRADVAEATTEARAVADAAPVATSPDGPSQTYSAGALTDLPLRTLAQEIGRVARPVATDGGPSLATTTAGQPNALRRDVEVELSAPEFGVVRVRMRLNGSSLELRLRTDDPATLALLAERRTELERAISETGVDAKVVDVSRTATSSSTASSSSPSGQAPTGDGSRGGEGQPFEQRPSPDRNDRRPPFDRQTNGSTPDEDPTSRAGTRPGTLFV